MSTDRRDFICRTCACLGALPAMNLAALSAESADQTTSMKDYTAKHLTEGYWSADSLLLSAVKHLGKPEETVTVAVGFGGGIQNEDLCGFLTGGVMSIGLYSGAVKGDDKASRDKCHRLTKEYYEWWKGNYPLHCGEITKPCDYKSMAASASEFLEAMFARETEG